jgi:hypothetical protein
VSLILFVVVERGKKDLVSKKYHLMFPHSFINLFAHRALSFSLTLISLHSVRTDLTEVGANSTLSVAKINKFDSGKR